MHENRVSLVSTPYTANSNHLTQSIPKTLMPSAKKTQLKANKEIISMEQQRDNLLTGSGTTSDATIKQEEKEPLVMIQERAVTKMMKVMVALDESDGSLYALNWALNNLLTPKSTAPVLVSGNGDGSNGVSGMNEEGCLVYLVHVQHSFQNYVYPAGPGLHTAAFASSSVIQSVKQAQAEISAGILERALSFCRHNKVRAETLILEGDPKEEICKATEQTHVDMLVIGSRGLGQFKRAFLGSVSDYCAHHASCPVLIVKPPQDAPLRMTTK